MTHLPPLPPLPPELEQVHQADGRSIIDVLGDEHRQLTVLSSALTEPRRADHKVAEVLSAVASRHMAAEEQYLYPTLRDALPDGDRLADVELAADDALRKALVQLETTPTDDAQFPQLAEEVAARLRRHAHVASTMLHPRLHETVDEESLIRLGNRVEVAEEAAPTRPHEHVPHRPPWNKVVEPLVGVADKVRDALSKRITYPDDL